MSMSNHDRRGQTFLVLAQEVIFQPVAGEKALEAIHDHIGQRVPTVLVNRPPHIHEVVFYQTKPPLRLRA
jgi:hypothetical protein